jgi:hypothetical protein
MSNSASGFLLYDLLGIEDYRQRCYEDTGALREELQVIISVLVDVGVPNISEKTIPTIDLRMGILAALVGIPQPAASTPKVLRKYLGLKTWVSPVVSSQFLAKCRKIKDSFPPDSFPPDGEKKCPSPRSPTPARDAPPPPLGKATCLPEDPATPL